ncbi:MAG: hypothetical protein H0T15_05775 [Thermoleophilaceae bacterium]|nr:hypothetical protein [Thermoleophilaceae bacterium]
MAALRGTPGLILGCVALAALSLLLPSTPTYDPWAWLIWGREVIHLDLDTQFGPSWKPLAVMFTVPFALFGDAQPELWLVVARAGGLLALAMAYRLASRLAGRPYGWLAGLAAVALLTLTAGWVRNSGLGNSEGLLVALLLWAVNEHLDGRHDRALYLGFAAALLRPEAWPFFGLYWLWLLRAEPALRVRSSVLLGLIPVLWFGPELIGSGDALRASSRAQEPTSSSAAFADQPWLEVMRSAHRLVPPAIEALTAVAVGFAAFPRPRERVVLGVALAALAWLGLVALMTQGGYSGNPRYIVPVGAVACVLAGVGLARIIGEVRTRAGEQMAAAAGATLCAVVIVIAVPDAREVGDDLRAMRNEARLYDDLPEAIEAAGGREALLRCGAPLTGPYQVQALAWFLDLHGRQVGFEYDGGRAVILAPRNSNEWRGRPAGLGPAGSKHWQVARRCRAPA